MRDVLDFGRDIDHTVSSDHAQPEIVEIDEFHSALPGSRLQYAILSIGRQPVPQVPC